MTIRPATSSSSRSSLSVSGVAGLGATSTAAGICLLAMSPRPISNLAKRLNKSVCSACRRRSSRSISPDSWFLLINNSSTKTERPESRVVDAGTKIPLCSIFQTRSQFFLKVMTNIGNRRDSSSCIQSRIPTPHLDGSAVLCGRLLTNYSNPSTRLPFEQVEQRAVNSKPTEQIYNNS